MNGKVVTDLLDTDPPCEGLAFGQHGMSAHGEELIEHGGEDHRFNVMEAAAVPEPVADFAGLLEGPELDLDAPAQRVEIGGLLRGNLVGLEVGDDDPPARSHQGFLFWLAAAPAPGFGTDVAAVGGGAFVIQADGDKAARQSAATDHHRKIETVAGRPLEDPVESLAIEIGGRDTGGQAADPECFAAMDLREGVEAEEAHVANEEVIAAAETNALEDQGLIGFAGGMELEVERFPGEQVGDEEALAAGGHLVPVAVVGEVSGVGFGHRDDHRVLDDDPPEPTTAQDVCGCGKALRENLADHAEKEAGTCWAEALEDPLTGHGLGDEPGEMHHQMVKRGVALDDGLEQGDEESCGAELVRGALDELRLAGDPIELIGLRQKMVFKHDQPAGLAGKSSPFRSFHALYRIDPQQLMSLA